MTRLLKLLPDFEKGLSEVQAAVEMGKEGQAQETVDRGSLRQCMAEDFEVPYGMTQRDELWDRHDGAYDAAASGHNFLGLMSPRRMNTDALSRFRRNHRNGGACIQSHSQDVTTFQALDFGRARNRSVPDAQFESSLFDHVRLEGSCIPFRQSIGSARHIAQELFAPMLKTEQFLINLIPVGGCGRGDGLEAASWSIRPFR